MSFNKKFFATGGIVASSDAVCTTETTDKFGDNNGVALYNLDYDASDAGGLYDGTPSNVTFGVGGAIGNYGARFNGSSSYIKDTGLYQQNIGSTSLWFKRNGNPTDAEILFASGLGSSNKGVIGQIMNNANNGKLRLIVQDSGGPPNAVDLRTSGNYNDNNWHHVVFTWDLTQTGSSIASRIYVDNTLVASDTIFGHNSGSGSLGWTSGNSTYDVHIGIYQTLSSTNAFDGDLDQMRFFDGVLTSDQVEDLYEETACVHTATTTNIDYPTTNLAYYKLDNSAEDSHSGTYDGTETDIEYRFGRYGQAAVFNGSSSTIDTGFAQNTSNAFSWSLWFKANTSSGINMIIDTTSNTSPFPGCGIGHANELLAGFIAGTTGNLTYSGNSISLNQWHHTVLTYNGSGSFKLYLDSVEVGSGTHTLNVNSNQNILIGNSVVSTWPGHNGDIDQVRIYSTALNSDQVSQLYNEKPETDTSNFKTVLYDGNSSTNYISNVGIDLETNGGLVWVKRRNTSADHYLVDSVRGNGSSTYKNLSSNTNNAEDTSTGKGITNDTFEASGFIMESNGARTNANGSDYVAWVWKGGGDAVTLTNAGNVNSDVSVNNEAGFSIVKASYGANGSGTGFSKTVKHGLDNPPEIIITKSLGTSNWVTMADTLIGEGKHLLLNDDASIGTDSGFVINTDGTFQTAYSTGAYDIIAYCWHSVAGYSKIGTYSGNANVNGTEVTTGFEPSFLLIKNINNTKSWRILDNKRGFNFSSGNVHKHLAPDSNSEENSDTTDRVRFTSTSFKLITASASFNESGNNNFLYMAFK